MTTELRLHNHSAQLYLSALSSAWRNGVQLYDPTLWLVREPELEEKMLRDADIAQALALRRHRIAGREWSLIPRREGHPASPLAVAVGTELLKGIKHFTQARVNLARAFFSGARFGRIVGRPRVLTIGDGQPRTWWVPTRIQDHDKRMFRIVPNQEGDENPTAHWEKWHIGKSDYIPETKGDALHTIRHLYMDDEGSLGHGRGLREALGWWWYAKEHVFAESLQAVDRFAQGILTAKIDGVRDAETGLPNTELITAWQAVLQDLRARNVVVYDSSDSIEMVQLDGSGWQLLTDIRKELRTTITTLILGANLTTTADSGGSYALADVQENSTQELLEFDRETLEDTLSDDLLGCIWAKNYPNLVELGIHEDKPRFSLNAEKKQDPSVRADVASKLNSIGVELALEDVLDQTGFRMPEPGEVVIPGGSQQVNPLGGGGLF